MPRRKAKVPPASYETYLFEVAIGTPSYSVSIAVPRHEPGLYSENWHLSLEGKCIAPLKYADRLVPFTFIAQREYFQRGSSDPNWKPPGVGFLTLRKDHADYLGSLPYDATWGVALGVSTGLFKYVHMDGQALRHGSAHMSYVSFLNRYDERDYFG